MCFLYLHKLYTKQVSQIYRLVVCIHEKRIYVRVGFDHPYDIHNARI